MKPSTGRNPFGWTALALILVILGAGVGIFGPRFFRTQAHGDAPQTQSHTQGLDYYDIRLDDSEAARGTLAAVRSQQGVTPSVRADITNGINELRARVPALKIEDSPDLGQPEVIGTDVARGGFLTAPSTANGAGQANAAAVRDFVRGNRRLFGLSDAQAATLATEADYANPDGNLSYVILSQRFNGLPVFRGEVSAMITRDGAIARMVNNLAPGLDETELARHGMNASDAVATAATYINRSVKTDELKTVRDNGANVEFERGQFDWPVTAEQMYFPTELGAATLAWRVLLWEPVAAYYVIVDAHSGALLWRKNIVEDQTQSATYNVYTQENPAPLSPGPDNPNSGTQGAMISRQSLAFIGNEAPNTFNNNGWITDAGNATDGNAIEAGIDRDGTNGVDPAGKPTSDTRQFVYAYNPGPGSPAPGEEPLPAAGSPLSEYQKGVVTQLFYYSNLYHDRLYRVGFTEAARNFQADNFGRGGTGADRVSGEAQDSSGTNNANFGTPADGGRGRMQMYLWTPPTPDRDGSLDADIVWHELTHGTSNRLIGNGSGLGLVQSRGMGEGWSDFYGRLMAATADEDINGTYNTGGYSTLNLRAASPTGNYYFGIRHFPYAVRSNVGPNGRPHNPLTFADVDASTANITDGAYTAPTAWTTTSVHALGEVWCSNLMEVRARLITRLGFEAGNTRMMQIVTDGMKVTPLSPNFIQARDAIIAADQANFGGADVDDIWAGFATRGMGFGATTNGTTATESFLTPNLQQTPAFTIADAAGNNNGFPEPGENITLSVPLLNPTASAITGVTASVNGGTAISYGDIAAGQTVTRSLPYTVPNAQACGSRFTFTVTINSSRPTVTAARETVVGVPVQSQFLNFDDLTPPALSNGWTSAVTGSGTNWVSSATTPDSAPNSLFTSNPATTGTAELTSPEFAIQTNNAQLSFRNNYNTQATLDGGTLEISIAGGAYQDILAAGGLFLNGGYSTNLGTGSALAGRPAWHGNSNGYITSTVALPAAANGQNVRFKWRFATNATTGGTGWNIDNVRLFNSYSCIPAVSGTVQFSGATFSVNEGTNFANVTITRTGATAGTTASVNYATTDGTASQRTDYITANGAVNWAAGETSKTFTISLIDDVYVEGNETLNLTLSSPNGSTLGTQATGVLTIQDNDTVTPTTNPSDTAQFFVRQQYLDFLAREPDAAGLSYWTGQITACGADVNCQRNRRRDVSAAFFIELEFQDTGSYVYRLHKAAYGQLPTYAQFTPDRARVIGGATVEAGKQAFVEEFATRPEFLTRYPTTQSGVQFIDALLATVLQGSQLDLSFMRQTLINDFNANGSRARVLRLVVDAQSFQDAEYRRGFVLMQYFGYLKRDIDPAGYDFWLMQIGGRVPNYAGMVCAFVTSQEYQQRFSPIFTHTNAECQ